MNYISLDLEWNQAYQEKALAVQKRLASRLRGEVIQIGAVKLDEDGNMCGSYSITVRPRYYKKILRHVARLTGITQERADRGVSLPEAAESFRRFCGEDFCFLTWGPDDIPMLEDNFRVHKLDTSWLRNTYDLQPIFNRQTTKSKNQPSLEFAMEYFGIPQNLPAHDALNDAYFTALVAARLDLRRGILEYTTGNEDVYLIKEIGNADTGGEGFAEPAAVIADKEAKSPVCPLCARPLECGRTLHLRNQRYTTRITCATHGDMFLNIKLLHNFDGTWRGVLRFVPATEESLHTYKERVKSETVSHRRRHRKRRPLAKKKDADVGAVMTEDADALSIDAVDSSTDEI